MPNIREDFAHILKPRPNIKQDFADILGVQEEPSLLDSLSGMPTSAQPAASTGVGITPTPEEPQYPGVGGDPKSGMAGILLGDDRFNPDISWAAAKEKHKREAPLNLSPTAFAEALKSKADETFGGVPRTMGELRTPEQAVRTIARFAIGAVNFLPTLGEQLAVPPEGVTRGQVLEEQGAGLLQMIRRFPFQMARMAGVEIDPTKPLNPLDELAIARGWVKPETMEEIDRGLMEAPEEPLFTAAILAGGIRGGRSLMRTLRKEPKPIAEQLKSTMVKEPESPTAAPDEGFVIKGEGGKPKVDKPIPDAPPIAKPVAPEGKITSKIIEAKDNNGIAIKNLQVNATPLKTNLDELIPFAKEKGLKSSEADAFYSLAMKGEIYQNVKSFGKSEKPFVIDIEKVKNAYTEFANKATLPRVAPEGKAVPKVKETEEFTPKRGTIEASAFKIVAEDAGKKVEQVDVINNTIESVLGKRPKGQAVEAYIKEYPNVERRVNEMREAAAFLESSGTLTREKDVFRAIKKSDKSQVKVTPKEAKLPTEESILTRKFEMPTEPRPLLDEAVAKSEAILKRPIIQRPPKPIVSRTPVRPVAPAVGDVVATPASKLKQPASLEESIKASAIGRQEVVDYFETTFKIPIRTGKFKQRDAGIFQSRGEVIRTKEANDLNAITHELGHYLEQKIYGKMGGVKPSKEATQELIKLGKDLYGDKAPTVGYKAEGMAEYISYWLTTDKAAEVAPIFSKFFETDLLAKDVALTKQLTKGAELLRQWREQGAVNRVYGNMDRNESPARKVIKQGKTREFVQDKLAEQNSLWADQIASLESIEKRVRGIGPLGSIDPKTLDPLTSPTLMARAVLGAAPRKGRMMVMQGTFDPALNTTGKSLREELAVVKPEQVRDALTYSYAARSVEVYKRDINPGISREDAQYVAKKLHSPEFEQFHKGITDFENRIIHYAVESGALTAKEAQTMIDVNPVHIPLKRAFEHQALAGGRTSRLTDVSSPIKRLKGSGLPIQDIIQSVVENTVSIINFADKARFARALFELADTPGAGRWIRKIDPPIKATEVSIGQLGKQLKEAGVDLSDASMDKILTIFSNAGLYKGRDNIISVVVAGRRQWMEVDPLLYKTQKLMDAYVLPKELEFFFGKPAKAIRLGATGLQVGFAYGTNPFRDAFGFALQSEYTRGTPELMLRGVFDRLFPNNKMNVMYKRSGADLSEFLGADRNSMIRARDEVLASTAKMKALNVVKHPIELLKDILSVTEAGPRIAEMRGAVKFGEQKFGKGSEQAAVLGTIAAQEVTTPFNRVGIYGRPLRMMMEFWNSSLQGNLKFARTVKEHPVRSFVKGSAYLTIPTLLIWDENKDKQWYREMPAWQKFGFWNFDLGTNTDGSPKIGRLPRPFTWGLVFAAAPEMMMDALYRKDPSGIKAGLKYLAKEVAPITLEDIPVIPQLLIETATNWNMFTDQPIDPYFETKYKVPSQRFSAYTSETAKFLGERLGYSPRKIEHILGSATGGLGVDIVHAYESVFDMKFGDRSVSTNIPILGRFFQRTDSPDDRINRINFYIDDEVQKIKNLREAGNNKEADEKTATLEKFIEMALKEEAPVGE